MSFKDKGYYLSKALGESKLDLAARPYSSGSSYQNPMRLTGEGLIVSAPDSAKGTSSRNNITKYATGLKLAGSSFEIGVRFRLRAEGNNAVFGAYNANSWARCPTIELHQTYAWMAVPSNGSSWEKQCSGSYGYGFDIFDRWVYLRLRYDVRSDYAVYEFSLDGISYATMLEFSTGNGMKWYTEELSWFGFYGSSNVGFYGDIDFLKAYVRDGEGSLLWGCDIDPRFYLT